MARVSALGAAREATRSLVFHPRPGVERGEVTVCVGERGPVHAVFHASRRDDPRPHVLMDEIAAQLRTML